MTRLQRWRHLLTFWSSWPEHLTRRVNVEELLLDAANSKAPVPTKAQCRVMALYLGDPRITTKEFRERMKNAA